MTTRQQAIELRVNNPLATLQQIGNICHITRERVRQILETEGLPSGKKLRRYISAGQCPWCKSGITFKILALHTYLIHGISGYELRALAGLNRSTSICDPAHSAKLSMLQKLKLETGKNPNFMNYDRSQIASLRERGLRSEGQENWSAIARTPERRRVFKQAMAKVNRKEVASRVPKEVRQERAKKAGLALAKQRGPEGVKLAMAHAREFRTPESEHIRAEHATATMNEKYRSDPEWCERWRARSKEGGRRRRKLSDSDRIAVIEKHNEGRPQTEIATEYGVSRSLIWLIVHGRIG
jgi:hypothetical protein